MELESVLSQLVQAMRFEEFENAPDRKALVYFIINRALASKEHVLLSYLFWYVKVESDMPYNRGVFPKILIYLKAKLKQHSGTKHDYIIYQQAMMKDIQDSMVHTWSSKSDRVKRQEYLRQILSNYKNFKYEIDHSKDTPSCVYDSKSKVKAIPLPLNPRVLVTGIKNQDCVLFRSALMPARITFTTSTGEDYVTIMKMGDDLRQDQLIVQLFEMMDDVLKQDNLDLKLTHYKVLAISNDFGFIECVPKIRAVADIFKEDNNTLVKFLDTETKLEKYVKSCAAYCIITYLLGIGDRHFDNLLMCDDGRIFHIDFGFIGSNSTKNFFCVVSNYGLCNFSKLDV